MRTVLSVSVPWRKSSHSPNEANCVEVTIVRREARPSRDRSFDARGKEYNDVLDHL
jgi:hypothetical protein